jgi:DNA-binding NtrC family response regulator
VEQNLGPGYKWPGNYRELEQCVRNVLIRRDYRPAPPDPEIPRTNWRANSARDDLPPTSYLRRYCTYLYRQTGSYEETARRLQIDRRTVKAKVGDPAAQP